MVETQDVKRDTGFGKRVVVEYVDFPIAGSILEIDQGKKTDMVFHRVNGRLLYLLAGKVRVSVLRDGIVNGVNVQPGASFYVKPGLVYQIEALERAIIIEMGFKEAMHEDVICIAKGSKMEPPVVVQTPVPEPTQVETPVAPPVEVAQVETPVAEPVVEVVQTAEPVKPIKRKPSKKKKLN